jgi:hypothetical protein
MAKVPTPTFQQNHQHSLGFSDPSSLNIPLSLRVGSEVKSKTWLLCLLVLMSINFLLRYCLCLPVVEQEPEVQQNRLLAFLILHALLSHASHSLADIKNVDSKERAACCVRIMDINCLGILRRRCGL